MCVARMCLAAWAGLANLRRDRVSEEIGDRKREEGNNEEIGRIPESNLNQRFEILRINK